MRIRLTDRGQCVAARVREEAARAREEAAREVSRTAGHSADRMKTSWIGKTLTGKNDIWKEFSFIEKRGGLKFKTGETMMVNVTRMFPRNEKDGKELVDNDNANHGNDNSSRNMDDKNTNSGRGAASFFVQNVG